MQYRGLNELREMYLKFFETKGHLRLPSFSLIPQNDPSLLLINSGMAPMKPFFTGEQEPPRHRVTTCQKCIRTGDIENVGKTARHGTFFEMLGNFSFGDYFKKEAIAWSWEFLTSPEWVGIDPELLYPSIYVDDDEAFEIWRQGYRHSGGADFPLRQGRQFLESMAPARAVPARKSTTTADQSSAAASPAARSAVTATGIWRFGTMYFPSSIMTDRGITPN